jgi:hypothetical protein
MLSAWGCSVYSVDIRSCVDRGLYFPVMLYDGKSLPFKDAIFDVVFSSNVLDDVAQTELAELLDETHRVLNAENGLAMHVLPSSTWRLWTSLGHYPAWVMKFTTFVMRSWNRNTGLLRSPVTGSPPHSKPGLRPSLKLVISVLVPSSQSTCSNALLELLYLRRSHWRQVFEMHRFRVLRVIGNGFFYTGYGLWPSMSLGARRKLARILGHSCSVFIMKPAWGGRSLPGSR